MYLDGYEKMAMVFDGQGSDQMTWFSPGRLISSPWTDLPGSTQFSDVTAGTYFSIGGAHGNRRFYIMQLAHGGCSPTGWTVVSTGECAFQKPIRDGIRSFLYSTLNTKASIFKADQVENADVMAVFVKQQ